MTITGEENRDELWLVMLRLLASSWRDIAFRYDGLTEQERACLTREQHARIVMLLKHPRPVGGASAAQRAGQLVERARSYAEGAIEGVDLEVPDRLEAPRCADDDLAVTRDMERITASIASSFVVGYGAALDDLHAAPRLGGVHEQERKARRKAAKK